MLTGCTAPSEPPSASVDSQAGIFDHIHELVPGARGGTLLVATHQGLYELTVGPDGGAPFVGPIGGFDFDPMGFTTNDGVFYASGHPGPTAQGAFSSPNLGLITSDDAGQSWTSVSLAGQIDFHGLAVASGGDGSPRVFGYDMSTGRVERSLDGGVTWDSGAELVARDLVAVGELLYATTPEGLAISEDDASSFSVDSQAPPLFILAGNASTLGGIDTSGTLWTQELGLGWVRGGAVTGTAAAIAIDGSRVFVADDRGIAFTDDAGSRWTVITPQA